MAVKRKMEQASAAVAVDARKLGQGLKTVFDGMSMVFDSLGVEMDMPEVNSEVAKETDAPESENKPSAEEKSKAPSAQMTGTEATKVQETAEIEVPLEVEQKKSEPSMNTEEEPKKEEPAQETPASVTPAVSIDDITKIIVQKIKQNRSNNEKIGAILKTYGAAKVGELPSSKYEAFLTDISAI